MAEIFLAVTMETGRVSSKPVVLKRVLPHLAAEPSFVKMFLNEASFCTQLDHPNIIRTFDYGEAEENHYLTMEHIAGQDLLSINQMVRRTGQRMPPELVAYICQKAAEGLQHAHELTDATGEHLGLVHRDVTPENILVGYDGSVKLLDFGIARAKGHTSETRSGVLKGKVGYVAPEQAIGRGVDHRADLFSLGIVAHELFTGLRLFEGLNDFVVLERLRTDPVPAPSASDPNISREVDELILSATQRDVNDRLSSAAEFAEGLATLFPTVSDEAGGLALKRWIRSAFAEQVVNSEIRADDYSRYEVLPDGQVVQHAPPIEDATSQWVQESEDAEAPETIAMRQVHPIEVSILGGRLDGTPPPNMGDLSPEQRGLTAPIQKTPGRSFLELPALAPKDPEDRPSLSSLDEGSLTPATTIDLSHPFEGTSSRSLSAPSTSTGTEQRSAWSKIAVTLLGCLLGILAAYSLLPSSATVGAGTLVIRVSPPNGLAVHLDGKLIAERAPIVIQGISYGQHRVAVERPGYRKYLTTFTYTDPQETVLDIKLVAIAPQTAHVKVTTSVRKPELLINDKATATAQMVAVSASAPVSIVLEADGYQKVSRELVLKAGERRDVLIEPEPIEGTLIVETRPPGTTFLNGTRHGRTPTTIRGLDVNRTWSLVVKGRDGDALKKTIRFGQSRLVTVDERLKAGKRQRR